MEAKGSKIDLVIFGSRNLFPTPEDINLGILDLNLRVTNIDSVVCGMAAGADEMGRRWAKAHNISIKPFYAKWSEHGKNAGQVRNELMAIAATHGVGFWSDNSCGTANMAAHMMLRKKPCILYQLNGQVESEALVSIPQASVDLVNITKQLRPLVKQPYLVA